MVLAEEVARVGDLMRDRDLVEEVEVSLDDISGFLRKVNHPRVALGHRRDAVEGIIRDAKTGLINHALVNEGTKARLIVRGLFRVGLQFEERRFLDEIEVASKPQQREFIAGEKQQQWT